MRRRVLNAALKAGIPTVAVLATVLAGAKAEPASAAAEPVPTAAPSVLAVESIVLGQETKILVLVRQDHAPPGNPGPISRRVAEFTLVRCTLGDDLVGMIPEEVVWRDTVMFMPGAMPRTQFFGDVAARDGGSAFVLIASITGHRLSQALYEVDPTQPTQVLEGDRFNEAGNILLAQERETPLGQLTSDLPTDACGSLAGVNVVPMKSRLITILDVKAGPCESFQFQFDRSARTWQEIE